MKGSPDLGQAAMCVRTQRLARPSIFGFEGVHFISKFLSIFLFPYNNKIGQKFNNIKCGFSLQYYDVQKLSYNEWHVYM